MTSRRNFIKTSTLGGIAASGIFPFSLADAEGLTGLPRLHLLCTELLNEWAEAVAKLQVTDRSKTAWYGGIYCPADKAVHGRCGDTIFPFLHLAHIQNQSSYLDASVLLYRWMENNVSQADGSWLNEPVPGSWKGTTVFAATSLAEAIKHHGSVLDNTITNEMINRLNKAGDFVFQNIDFKYGNINYPVSAAYCLSLLGEILDNKKFSARGKELAQGALSFFTKKDMLLYGEGDLEYKPSPKGCAAIDLGYNVEESLPALVQYALLNNDKEVLETVMRSMKQHLEFMLPDGAWDNSWGTRNFKWTYWGSRTSDGCQTAYGLLADREPVFYKAALMNTLQWKENTYNGLLTGGPHCHSRGIDTCVHHTFSHMKALATVLNHPVIHKDDNTTLQLPREKEYGSRFFEDIQTWLVSKGKFRATVTTYDKEYKKTRNGHASGGALTMLWHEKTGPLLTASMNEYQLYEPGNMQKDIDPFSMPLTPRVEVRRNGIIYMNICDLSAIVILSETKDAITIEALSQLVDKDQHMPGKTVRCKSIYTFTSSKVSLKFEVTGTDENETAIILPIISNAEEKLTQVSEKEWRIDRKGATIKIHSDKSLQQAPISNKNRVFNYVPGLEAIPAQIKSNTAVIEIAVL